MFINFQTTQDLDPSHQSFFGTLAAPFGLYGSPWLGHLAGAAFGMGFFAILILVTRGKGMGMGDMKLGLPLGFLFGWPDVVPVYMSAFVIGGIVGIFLIARGAKGRKSAVPFVPFLALGAVFVFFLGSPTLEWYLRIIGL